MPSHGERDVPTNVVPVYSSTSTGFRDLSVATFELASAFGGRVAVAPVMTFAQHFELVPEGELEPSTEYTLHVTLPPRATGQPSVDLSLSFSTGSGPSTEAPAPPSVKMQHYHALDAGTTCDPPEDGSCLFFSARSALEITYPESSSAQPSLTFGPWFSNLTGVNQGTPWTCVTLRTRALDGKRSEAIDVCREDAESLTVPSTTGLRCTENGVVHMVTGGAGGGGAMGGSSGFGAAGAATGGTGTAGTATGGAEIGGTGTGGAGDGGASSGAGNSAGTHADDSDSRSVVTEGCGCRVPGSERRGRAATWLALAAVGLGIARRMRLR